MWAVVSLVVRSVNDPPSAVADNFVATQNQTLVVTSPGVLDNDSDVDSLELSTMLIRPPLHGTSQLQQDGSFVYTPNSNFNREDAFTYIASDGTADSQPATVQIIVDTAYPWYNSIRPLNVNDDGSVSPLDALLVVNELNTNGSHRLSLDRTRPLTKPFLDVTCDGNVSPLDALWVINYLNRPDGEGESIAASGTATTPWGTMGANAETREPEGDVGDKTRSSVSRVAGSGPSTSFLQTLDLLFARFDEAASTRDWETATNRRDTPAGDLEEFLGSMLNGIADEEELLATTTR